MSLAALCLLVAVIGLVLWLTGTVPGIGLILLVVFGIFAVVLFLAGRRGDV